VLAQRVGELRDERDVPHRCGGLGRYPPRRGVAVGARELGAHVDQAGAEIDVIPDEAEQLGDPQAGVERR
jgi:hypothetical protein